MMTVIEYLKAKGRMTKKCTISCTECPLSDDNNGKGCLCEELEQNHPEKAIEIVERWAKEHPIKTRQSEFLKMFPNAPIDDDDGSIKIKPCEVDTLNYGLAMKSEHCASTICHECKKKFWSEEIE